MTTFFSAPTSPIFEIISFFLIFYVYQLQYTEVTKTKKTLFLRCFLEVRGEIFGKFDLLIDSLTMYCRARPFYLSCY